MKPSLVNILPTLSTIHIVDIGANPIDGQAPYTALLQKKMTKLIGFEPNLDALAILNQQKSEQEHYFLLLSGREKTRISSLPSSRYVFFINP